MFKNQQERCVKFLRLSDDYANKYLLDIDAEVQQQSSVLDNPEERLYAAKKLHGEAVDLQKFYESGTVASMNDLRATGRRSPVPRDFERWNSFRSSLKQTIEIWRVCSFPSTMCFLSNTLFRISHQAMIVPTCDLREHPLIICTRHCPPGSKT